MPSTNNLEHYLIGQGACQWGNGFFVVFLFPRSSRFPAPENLNCEYTTDVSSFIYLPALMPLEARGAKPLLLPRHPPT
eukprot:NODE_963_length_537_cov_220.353659_g953_i0.p2 GENE.NODE_963_length_537_cov_220.353659_g953_i0~~NODE_963_length_537_cov_220.353659_g953_i0.p2  ORF type:complete len:78 (-),score=7.21 NODE_963_length_537_cov_220.353659_g953_i0:35-268(-)